MRPPPAGRLCALVVFLHAGASALAKQCALVAPGRALANPGNTNAVPTATVGGAHPGSSSGPTATGSGGVGPSPTAFAYGDTPVRGVNLSVFLSPRTCNINVNLTLLVLSRGGWFVLEPWITPSLFKKTGNDAIIDEYTFGQMQDYDTALAALTAHWETWVTEDDFVAIQEAGLNHVRCGIFTPSRHSVYSNCMFRLPIGYWSVPIDQSETQYNTSVSPYIPGAWPYILRALNWAQAHSIHVILDLHGAPGSQNGCVTTPRRIPIKAHTYAILSGSTTPANSPPTSSSSPLTTSGGRSTLSARSPAKSAGWWI